MNNKVNVQLFIGFAAGVIWGPILVRILLGGACG